MKKNLNKQFPLTLAFPFMLSLALALTLALVSCSDDDIVATNTTIDPVDKYAVTGTMASVKDFREGDGDEDPVAKSQFYFDRVNSKLFFTWVAGDKIGIFPNNLEGEQAQFVLDSSVELQAYDGTGMTGVFEPVDKGADYPILVTQKYFSYFPYINDDFSYDAVPVSYANQSQGANEKMYLYFNRTTGDNAAQFLESEKAAAAHTSAYDFMVSEATSTLAAHVHFEYKHMGAMARFYMYTPEIPETYEDGLYIDSLQVVNNDRNFIIDATMDISTQTLTSVNSSRVMSLQFSPAIDMTNYGELSDNTLPSYQYWRTTASGKKYGYIMAYMMLAPVDLTAAGIENSTLYMITRKPKYYTTVAAYNEAKGTSLDEDAFNALKKHERMKIYETKEAYNAAKLTSLDDAAFNALTPVQKMKDYERKVYKATLSKINFEAGKHYQWNVTDAAEDEPITFQEITIQEWEEGTGFTNTDGVGTEDW